MTQRVAFVVQRCGLEVNGGAELLCRLVAEQMSKRTETEVLTTCALDYLTWANHYPPGEERIGELRIRRFPVDRPRDPGAFGQLCERLRPRIGSLPLAEEERWMREQGPWSPELLGYIEAHRADYDAFIFFTYLYATTYFGLPPVAPRAILVPTAHDEWPIYFRMWDRLVELPQRFVFQTEEELAFMRRRFPRARLEGPILGVAVEPPAQTNPDAFRMKYGVDTPFVLYAGRLDPSKGVSELIENFEAYRLEVGDFRTELVLVGKAAMEIPARPGIRILGFLPDQDKWDALAACEAFIMPSPYESLSIACLEAWSLGKPALVTAKSEVLMGQCRRSQGGLWYADAGEFCAALELLVRDATVRQALGAQGQRFVAANYRWPRIIDAYCDLVSGIRRSS
jgi:glycosyltransferase involved in cell wall biosynthesis